MAGRLLLCLAIGSPDESYSRNLLDYLEQQINADNIPLSSYKTECDIVFNGQTEPHLKQNFINFIKNVIANILAYNLILKKSSIKVDLVDHDRLYYSCLMSNSH